MPNQKRTPSGGFVSFSEYGNGAPQRGSGILRWFGKASKVPKYSEEMAEIVLAEERDKQLQKARERIARSNMRKETGNKFLKRACGLPPLFKARDVPADPIRATQVFGPVIHFSDRETLAGWPDIYLHALTLDEVNHPLSVKWPGRKQKIALEKLYRDFTVTGGSVCLHCKEKALPLTSVEAAEAVKAHQCDVGSVSANPGRIKPASSSRSAASSHRNQPPPSRPGSTLQRSKPHPSSAARPDFHRYRNHLS